MILVYTLKTNPFKEKIKQKSLDKGFEYFEIQKFTDINKLKITDYTRILGLANVARGITRIEKCTNKNFHGKDIFPETPLNTNINLPKRTNIGNTFCNLSVIKFLKAGANNILDQLKP